MYHLLVGRPPFEADSPLALAVKHLHDDPIPIAEARPVQDLPPWLCKAIEKLMAKAIEDRFQIPHEFSEYVRLSMVQAGAVGAGSARLTTRIDATKTLQRLVNQEASLRDFRPFVAIASAVLLPLVALAGGMWLGKQQPTVQLSQFLAPGDLEIPTLEAVDAQYLEAVRLNEPEGWKKVIEAFPASESQTNAAYGASATIQLARLYRKREQLESATAILQNLLANPDLSVLYRAVGLVELFETQTASGELAAAEKTRSELRNAYDGLQKSPANQRIFDTLYPTADFGSSKQS